MILTRVIVFCLMFMLVLAFEDLQTAEVKCSENYTTNEATKISTIIENRSSNSVIIIIQCATVTFNQSLNFSNMKHLHLKGINNTILQCSKNANLGLFFANITNLILENITVNDCGSPLLKEHPAVTIQFCNDVTIKDVTINNSNGTGMILNRNNGQVTINNSNFQNCYRLQQCSNCYQYNGGGLVILYHMHIVQINHCLFRDNSAYTGGGMSITVKHKVNILIKKSLFHLNTAQAGGGVRITYHESVPDTSITFEKCIFESNNATEGGGTSVSFTTFNHLNLNFSHCLWTTNSFQAVNLENRQTKKSNFTPIFFNCNFIENGNIHHEESTNAAEGNAFVANDLAIQFQGVSRFENNIGSAIKAVLSYLIFDDNSMNIFIGNKGTNGGALQLIGNTVMKLGNNQLFLFRNNTAKEKGNVIYMDPYKQVFSIIEQNCFVNMTNVDTSPENFNTKFTFEENFSREENILHATSIMPCLQQGIKQYLVWKNITEKVSSSHFTTAAYAFVQRNKSSKICPAICPGKVYPKPQTFTSDDLCVTPGKKQELSFQLVDEFCNYSPFDVIIKFENKAIHFSRTSTTLIHDSSITLYGKPGSKSKVILTASYSTPNTSPVRAQFEVTMDHCPPGFVFHDKKETCICSLLLSSNKHYVGIADCNSSVFQAQVRHGYWVGYINENHTQNNFASSICPEGFCRSCSNYTCEREPLPSNRNEDTSSVVCSENRQDVMCGACKPNHSAFYHSDSFSCKENKRCSLGWLFYILSELLPVTVLFLVIIFFNISFTSGPLNGVIFFTQIVSTMKLNAENFIVFDDHVQVLSGFYKFVYQVFTLNFFSSDALSFCLWEGTSALDMLAFRYFTIVYSLLLVIATILLLKLCSLSQRMLHLKRSIIHGLSAFLIMSYSECTRVSLSILTIGTLYVSPDKTHPNKYVAFYNGNYPYMKAQHLKYAIPAIFFLATLVIIPPLLLLIYPLCYRIFALLRIEESKFQYVLCKIVPLEKIKPLFDSMQGAFKDQFRFFAGMYFLYRFSLQLTFTWASTLNAHYSITAIQLIFILFLHGICRPYKNSWHNALDSFFFLLLNAINIITIFNYQLLCLPKNDDHYKYILAFSNLQCVLTLFPLIYLIVYTTYRIVKKVRITCKCIATKKQEEHEDINYILHELDTRSIDN